jgi:hypothetical protein
VRQEVGTRPFEGFVPFCFEDEDDVARRDAGFLVALTMQYNLCPVSHALFYVNVDPLLFLDRLLPFALLAPRKIE